MTSYLSLIVTIDLQCTVLKLQPFENLVTPFYLSRSSKVKGHSAKRKLIYDFLSVANSNYRLKMYQFQVRGISRKIQPFRRSP